MDFLDEIFKARLTLNVGKDECQSHLEVHDKENNLCFAHLGFIALGVLSTLL